MSSLEEIEKRLDVLERDREAMSAENVALWTENFALKAELASLRSGVVTGGVQVYDESIPDPILRATFGHYADHRDRQSHSIGYHGWGGRAKMRMRGGFYAAESGDTIDAGFYGGHYDLSKIGPASILPPYTYGSAMAYLHASRLTGYPPRAEGRACEISLNYGSISIKTPQHPGSSNADLNLCRTLVHFGPPQEFSGAWKGNGIGIHLGFFGPRDPNDRSKGSDVKLTPILIGRVGELPKDAFVLYVKRPV